MVLRRVASNLVIVGRSIHKRYVVEIEDGQVVRLYKLMDELPMTEWMDGTIHIYGDEDGKLRAKYEGAELR